EVAPTIDVRREIVAWSEREAIEAAVKVGAGEAASVGAAEARQHLADAEAALIAEPFAVDAPLAAASQIPIEPGVGAVPLGGLASDVRIVLRPEVAFEHHQRLVRKFASIDK